MSTEATTLEQFMELFQGSTTYYGESKATEKTKPNGKREYDSWINKKPVTIEDFRAHINGTRHIGTVPIKDDSTCSWGVIDVDVYNLNHKELIKTVRERKYPLVPYRSKSNGLHLVLHIDGSVPAFKMRRLLNDYAADLGVAGTTTDIFPAQDQVDLTPEKWEDKSKGNFVNLPYQHAARTTRMALYDNGMGVPLNDLYNFVTQYRVSPKQFDELKIDQQEFDKLGYPPCVVSFLKNGVEEGEGRNDAMFNVAVMCKKINPDEDYWPEHFRELNRMIGEPPLDPKELNTLIKQHTKTDYKYKCQTSIAKAHCNRQKCVGCKFGINPNEAMPEVGRLQKYNVYPEPYWVLPVNGTNIKLDNKELYSQQLFGAKLLAADIVWRNLKASKQNPDPWSDFKEELIKNKIDIEGYDHIEEKDDIFNSRMVQFIEDSESHADFNQIDNGYIWLDHEDKHQAKELRFKTETFLRFMKKLGNNWSNRECSTFLQTGGAEPKKKHEGHQTRHWIVAMPRLPEYTNKEVKHVKAKAPWENN